MRILVTFLCTFLSLFTSAQDSKMTGTWEGDFNGQFLQINIVVGNDRLCGYTWDYVFSDTSSHCKAYFTATYDPSISLWNFTGIGFIEHSEDHELMKLRFKLSYNKKVPVLKGYVGLKSDNSIFSNSMDYVELKKVSAKPALMYPFMKDCIKEAKRKPKKITKAVPPVIVKKSPPKKVAPPALKNIIRENSNIKTAPPIVKNNENKTNQPAPIIQNNNEAALRKMSVRKRTEAARVEINVRHIELKVYDNGIVDGDSVSIFYNKRLIVSKKRLTEKPIIIPLDLDENTDIHEITMFAENLGSIPPNTALIVITAGDKRFELRSSATLDTNSVLVFEYKPR